MFETSLNTINLSGTEFPVKCSLLVLEQIQDKYGDYKAFENKIFRFTPDLDEKGEMIPMGEGMVRGKFGDPDVSALKDGLYMMVAEGMAIRHEPFDLTPDDLIRLADMPPSELGNLLHEEFLRAFERKNPPKPTQKKRTTKKTSE